MTVASLSGWQFDANSSTFCWKIKRLEQFRFHNGGVGLSRKSVGSFLFVFMLVSACTCVRLSVFGWCGGGGDDTQLFSSCLLDNCGPVLWCSLSLASAGWLGVWNHRVRQQLPTESEASVSFDSATGFAYDKNPEWDAQICICVWFH